MEIFFDFKPLKSLCGVVLNTITPQNVSSVFGEPEEIEKGENNSFGEASFSYHFNNYNLTLFFDVDHLLCLSVSDPSFKLFGEDVMKLTEEELIYLFNKNGFTDNEVDKDWGEKQLIFDSAGVTIFFDNQKVSEIFIDA